MKKVIIIILSFILFITACENGPKKPPYWTYSYGCRNTYVANETYGEYVPLESEIREVTIDTIELIKINQFNNNELSISGTGKNAGIFLLIAGASEGNIKIDGKTTLKSFYSFYSIDKDSTLKRHMLPCNSVTINIRSNAHYIIVTKKTIKTSVPLCIHEGCEVYPVLTRYIENNDTSYHRAYKYKSKTYTTYELYIDRHYIVNL